MITSDTKITDIHALINVMTRVNDLFGGQIWWRGHSNTTYHLQPSVFRPREGDGGFEYEKNINYRFMQKAPALRNDTPVKDSWFDWLFLMQHYGLPTRLLDWTESPLIACYFAVEEASEKTQDVDGALFALNPYRLNYYQAKLSGLLNSQVPQAFQIAQRAFVSADPSQCKVLAIAPNLIDIRMISQLSGFTIHDERDYLEENVKSDDFLVKFEIPAQSKEKLREQLKHAGLRPSSLFPDLEHLSKEVKSIRKFSHASGIKKIDTNKLRE